MQLKSGVAAAVVQAGSCSSDSTPSLGTSMCRRCSLKKEKKKNSNKNLDLEHPFLCQPSEAERGWDCGSVVRKQAWGKRAYAGIWPLPCKPSVLNLPKAPPCSTTSPVDTLDHEMAGLSCTGHDSIFSFVGHGGTVSSTQLSCCSIKQPWKRCE